MKAFSTNNRLERTRWYMGGYWVFLATAKDTGGRFSLIELNLVKGLEPPRHMHTNEDESFYVLEGEIRFFTGEEQHDIKTHEFLHIPRGIPHHFKLVSDTAKVLMHLTPGGLEEMFIEMSTAADALAFPPRPQGPPPQEWLERMHVLQKQFGIVGIDNSKIKSI
jgi:quercetin dioxygenase-like cupin family protein